MNAPPIPVVLSSTPCAIPINNPASTSSFPLIICILSASFCAILIDAFPRLSSSSSSFYAIPINPPSSSSSSSFSSCAILIAPPPPPPLSSYAIPINAPPPPPPSFPFLHCGVKCLFWGKKRNYLWIRGFCESGRYFLYTYFRVFFNGWRVCVCVCAFFLINFFLRTFYMVRYIYIIFGYLARLR